MYINLIDFEHIINVNINPNCNRENLVIHNPHDIYSKYIYSINYARKCTSHNAI